MLKVYYAIPLNLTKRESDLKVIRIKNSKKMKPRVQQVINFSQPKFNELLMTKAKSKGLAALNMDLQVSKNIVQYESKRKENPLRSEKTRIRSELRKADLLTCRPDLIKTK